MTWLEVPGKPKLLRSGCEKFTIFRDERFQPPIFSVTKWLLPKERRMGDAEKRTLGRFDSIEDAQRACEAAI
jgi:hypothetical protein